MGLVADVICTIDFKSVPVMNTICGASIFHCSGQVHSYSRNEACGLLTRLLPDATDVMDGNGLKLEKIGQFFFKF